MSGSSPGTEKPSTRLRRRAMDFLARREHTYVELQQKLIQRFPEDDESLICEVLDRLREQDLQSDERFMESYLNHRLRAGMGPLKLGLELRQKGIDSSCSDTLLSTVSQETWEEMAADILRRKYSDEPVAINDKQKAWRFLMQRGFDSGIIQKAMKQAWIKPTNNFNV